MHRRNRGLPCSDGMYLSSPSCEAWSMRSSADPKQASAPSPIDHGSPLAVVLFGIGSPIVAEHVETCRRLGWSIIAAIRNRDGDVHFDDAAKIRHPSAVDPAVLAYPCLCPLFTPANRAIATREAATGRPRFAC